MSERIALIDYGSGNLHSAHKALERAAREAGVDAVIELTDRPDLAGRADRIVLPGVGSFGGCAAGLRACDGMVEALEKRVLQDGVPFLGICVGAQLMAQEGFELGRYAGLGWLQGTVEAIDVAGTGLKVPHMGWNTLIAHTSHPVLAGVATPDQATGASVYFVHSFHVKPSAPDLIATATYGHAVNAVIGRENMIGTQFHPEKSQRAGLQLLANFLTWRPR